MSGAVDEAIGCAFGVDEFGLDEGFEVALEGAAGNGFHLLFEGFDGGAAVFEDDCKNVLLAVGKVALPGGEVILCASVDSVVN